METTLSKKIRVHVKRALWYEKWEGGVKKAICQIWGWGDPKKKKVPGVCSGTVMVNSFQMAGCSCGVFTVVREYLYVYVYVHVHV